MQLEVIFNSLLFLLVGVIVDLKSRARSLPDAFYFNECEWQEQLLFFANEEEVDTTSISFL